MNYFLGIHFAIGLLLLILLPKIIYLLALIIDNVIGVSENRFVNALDNFYFNTVLIIFRFIFILFIIFYMVYNPLLDFMKEESIQVGTLTEDDGKFYIGDKRMFYFIKKEEIEKLVGTNVKYSLRTNYILLESSEGNG